MIAGHSDPAVRLAGYSLGTFWFAGLAGAGLFLGSLAAHELSHAIAARRAAGVEVEDSTFWLFGGVSRLRQELPTPRLQLLVAGSGRSPACCSVRHSGSSACLWPRPVSAGWLWARCAGRR
jgi:hypothetical protein